jgi:hypothetical protein
MTIYLYGITQEERSEKNTGWVARFYVNVMVYLRVPGEASSFHMLLRGSVERRRIRAHHVGYLVTRTELL